MTKRPKINHWRVSPLAWFVIVGMISLAAAWKLALFVDAP